LSIHGSPAKDASRKYRKECGAYLRKLRVAAELTQRDLGEMVGFKYYTFISQIEAGTARLPSEYFEAYAKALGVAESEFVRTVLQYYDPFVYKSLFGSRPR